MYLIFGHCDVMLSSPNTSGHSHGLLGQMFLRLQVGIPWGSAESTGCRVAFHALDSFIHLVHLGT